MWCNSQVIATMYSSLPLLTASSLVQCQATAMVRLNRKLSWTRQLISTQMGAKTLKSHLINELFSMCSPLCQEYLPQIQGATELRPCASIWKINSETRPSLKPIDI